MLAVVSAAAMRVGPGPARGRPGFQRGERDRHREPDDPERHADLRDEGSAPILRDREQHGENRGDEAHEREERGMRAAAGTTTGRVVSAACW